MADFAQFEGNPDFVLSLARGLSVIEAFEDRSDGVTVAGIASRTGLSRASVRRILITLDLLGYATRSGTNYRLTSRMLRVGFSFLSSFSLSALALPILEEISAAIHESSSLSVLEGDEIVYLARAGTKRVMAIGLSVGSRLPAYCTSMGRVLLAALPEAELSAYLPRVKFQAHTAKSITTTEHLLRELHLIREQGYALVDEELELGLRAIAVPVTTRTGRVVAALNTGVHASRVTVQEMKHRLLPILKQGAETLQRSLP